MRRTRSSARASSSPSARTPSWSSFAGEASRFRGSSPSPFCIAAFEVGLHRLDLFVANEIVVELKATKDLADIHFVVVRSYLRAVGRDHGLILNFPKEKLEAKRVKAHS